MDEEPTYLFFGRLKNSRAAVASRAAFLDAAETLAPGRRDTGESWWIPCEDGAIVRLNGKPLIHNGRKA